MSDIDLGALKKRIQKIEDMQVIKDLKVVYARACDDCYNPEKMGDVFSEDAVWDGGEGWGRHEGIKVIQDFFREARKDISFAVHYFVQPEIRLAEDGMTASATWYLWQAFTINDTAMWLSALEHDKYVKVDERWWQTEMILDPFFVSSYEDGWHKPEGTAT